MAPAAMPGISKGRWTPDAEGRALLETIFQADNFPARPVRLQLAEALKVNQRQIQVWFQNRRQRLKREQEGAGEGAAGEGAGSELGGSGARGEETPPPGSAPLFGMQAHPGAGSSSVEGGGGGRREATRCLARLLESRSGARALRGAARAMLHNNPLMRHPRAPCHRLLAQLSTLEIEAEAEGEGAPPLQSAPTDVEALEGLSSLFYSKGGNPSS